jgi:hypothetical protein
VPDTLNPVQVEERIRQLGEGISNMVGACDRAYREFLRADHEYDLAVARAEHAFTGPAWRAKGEVTLQTEKERRRRDDTDAAYRYADRRAKALESELRAWQSVGASVRAAYNVAGRGES